MTQHQVDTVVLLHGFEAARQRLGRSLPGTDEAFHAIFEALAWAGSIRDRLKDDGIPRPPVLDGLYYIRNVVLHQGADVLPWLYEPAATVGGTFRVGTTKVGPGLKAWVWPFQGDFNPPLSPAGEREYVALLEGQDASGRST